MDSYKVFIPYLPIKANSKYMKRVFEKLGLKSFKEISFKQYGKGSVGSYYTAIAEFEGINRKEWDSFFIHLDWEYKVHIQHKYGKIRLLKFKEDTEPSNVALVVNDNHHTHTTWAPMIFEKRPW